METTRKERVRIGAFMLLCGILILIFLGYVLSTYLNREYDNYYTIFNKSVTGLYGEAHVKLNGIDVGNVTGIHIDSANLNQVIVSFRVDKGTPIKKGTRAGMTHGISLTGEKQIILSGGNFDEPDVPEGGFVPAEESAFDEIASQAGNIVGRVDTLLHNLNNIFSSENAENISKAIKNLEVATKNRSSLSQNLDKPISNISEAAGSMKNIMTEIEEAKIAAKAGEDLDVLREKLDAIDTKNINDNLNQAMASVNKLTKRLDQMIYKNEDQVGNAVTELNAVLSNLEEFSQKIKNNPSMLIHSETKERRK